MESLKDRIIFALTNKTNRPQENAILADEAHKIKGHIFEQLLFYYNFYQPKVYRRRSELLYSLRIEKEQNDYIVYFDEKLANHMSVYGTHTSFVPTLMDKGWYYKQTPYRFGQYRGAYFIRDGIYEYRKGNNDNILISIDSKYESDYYQKVSLIRA